MGSRPSASIDLVGLLVSYLEKFGFHADEALAEAGLDSALLVKREQRIPFEQYLKIWKSVAEMSGDIDFGLHFGEAASRFPSGHLLNAVMMNSPSVKEALERFFRFHGLMSDAVLPRIQLVEDDAIVTIEQAEPEVRLGRQYNEANLCTILSFIRKLSEFTVKPIEVWFTHSMPSNVAEHKRIFGCPLAFEQAENRLLLSREVLSRQLRHADPELLEMVARVAGARLEKISTSAGWMHKVEKAILSALLDGGKLQADTIAGNLAVSRRLLQRKLQEEGITFQQVLDKVRKEVALDYLEHREASLAEIAFLLGFSEQSAFNHAFKRWTGSTPGEYRKL